MKRWKQEELAPGDILGGKYIIKSILGKGGMGVVYRAVFSEIDRPVAIKTINSKVLPDEEFVTRFYREARAAGSILHENICEVTDVGKTEHGNPFLVMPLLQGQSLRDLLHSEKLSYVRVVNIGIQVLSALEAAHAKHFIHRDLKPDNIFITKVGENEDFVKVLDFGISKIVDDEDETTKLTETGRSLGTPYYMSPEQISNREIGPTADIYAMGVILYQGVTGERPFERDFEGRPSSSSIFYNIIQGNLLSPSRLNPGIPSDLERIIMKALSSYPERRFSSASEMKEALKKASLVPPTHFVTQVAPKEKSVNYLISPTESDDHFNDGFLSSPAICPPTIPCTQTSHSDDDDNYQFVSTVEQPVPLYRQKRFIIASMVSLTLAIVTITILLSTDESPEKKDRDLIVVPVTSPKTKVDAGFNIAKKYMEVKQIPQHVEEKVYIETPPQKTPSTSIPQGEKLPIQKTFNKEKKRKKKKINRTQGRSGTVFFEKEKSIEEH